MELERVLVWLAIAHVTDPTEPAEMMAGYGVAEKVTATSRG